MPFSGLFSAGSTPGAWLGAAIRHRSADMARRAPLDRPSLEAAPEGPAEPLDESRGADPASAAALTDLWEQAPALLAALPPPFRQIAVLQFLEGWTRKEIARWLRRWRPIGWEEARRLITEGHRQIRSLGGPSQGPCGRLAGLDPKENPWRTTPPPPAHRLEP